MSRLGQSLLALLLFTAMPVQAKPAPALTTKKLMAIAAMAARHDGYDLSDHNFTLEKTGGMDSQIKCNEG